MSSHLVHTQTRDAANNRMWFHWWYVDDHGEIVVTGRDSTNALEADLRRARGELPKQGLVVGGCSKCGRKAAPVVQWAGVRWHGKPWLLRWRIWAGWPVFWPEDGCGCMVKLKAATTVAKQLVRTIRGLWRVVQNA